VLVGVSLHGMFGVFSVHQSTQMRTLEHAMRVLEGRRDDRRRSDGGSRGVEYAHRLVVPGRLDSDADSRCAQAPSVHIRFVHATTCIRWSYMLAHAARMPMSCGLISSWRTLTDVLWQHYRLTQGCLHRC
jgi:hypothetical protein